MEGELPANSGFTCPLGEKGGVGVPDRRAESSGRGVDPLDPGVGACIGVL